MTGRGQGVVAGLSAGLLVTFAMTAGATPAPVCAGMRVRSEVVAGSVRLSVGQRRFESAVPLAGGRTLLVDVVCK